MCDAANRIDLKCISYEDNTSQFVLFSFSLIFFEKDILKYAYPLVFKKEMNYPRIY